MNSFNFFHGGFNEINITLETRQVIGHVRRLGVQWTPQIVQDIEAINSIDIGNELVQELSEEIARQINNDLIYYLTKPINFKFFT